MEDNANYIYDFPLESVGDTLVIAGDTGYLGDHFSDHWFWDKVSEAYKQVIVIPGNHELYGGYDLSQMTNGFQQQIRPNVTLCYNAVIPLSEDTDLIATTLWSKIRFENGKATERGINDFHKIVCNGKRLTWQRFNEEHAKCLDFLKHAVADSKARHIIVATHHVPSERLMSPEFIGSSLNGAFTVELGDYIESSPIEYWIYGHSHRNIDRKIGNAHCVCNQLGYVPWNEQKDFRSGKFIEV